jgi:hypothetical protein
MFFFVSYLICHLKVTNDQSHNIASLEPSASLACHIIQYLFTSSPRPLLYRRSTTDQRMITASFRCICFNTFLLVLKCLFLLSEPKNQTPNNRVNKNNSAAAAAAAATAASASNGNNSRSNLQNDEQL